MLEAGKVARRDFFSRQRLPVMCAPMFLVSYPDLILAACKANISAGCSSSTARSASEYADWLDRFDDELAQYRKATGKPTGRYAANISLRASATGAAQRFEADILTCKSRRVPLLITINGAPNDVVKEVHGWGGMVFHDVTTIRHAEKAALAGVDGMILIAGGGGGHSGSMNPFVLLSAVRKFFDGYLVLAGAVTTGAHVMAARILGADLCYMGTRFIATVESGAPRDYKNMIVASSAAELIYTPFFTHGVPANMMTRSIARAGFDPRNLSTSDAGEPSQKVKAWRDIWAAGQGVELIGDIPTVQELVDRLTVEYEEAGKL